MFRWWILAGACACSSSTSTPVAPAASDPDDTAATSIVGDALPAPIAVAAPPDAAASAPVDVGVDASVDAETAPPPRATPPKPRAPGIYPVLVVHPQDDEAHAYLLACAQAIKGKPSKLLAPAACAKVVGTPKVELVGDDDTRTPVKLGKKGNGDPRPDGGSKQPWRSLTGLPVERGAELLVLPVGIALDQGEFSKAALDAIASKHSFADKRQQRPGAPARGVPVVGQLDLDGDGVFEIITSNLGSIRLFRSDGTLVGEVGCESG